MKIFISECKNEGDNFQWHPVIAFGAQFSVVMGPKFVTKRSNQLMLLAYFYFYEGLTMISRNDGAILNWGFHIN